MFCGLNSNRIKHNNMIYLHQLNNYKHQIMQFSIQNRITISNEYLFLYLLHDEEKKNYTFANRYTCAIGIS